MKVFALIVFCCFHLIGGAQTSYESWYSVGSSKEIRKNHTVGIELNTRIYNGYLQSFFPEISYKHKFNKWLKLSLDYRGIMGRNKYANYHYSNRLNFNTYLSHKIKRYDFGVRLRYQYGFNGILSTEDYTPEFDQGLRFKPSVKYNIKKSKITPFASVEWFYAPNYSLYGRRFTKYRLNFGFSVNLKHRNEVSVGYLYARAINLPKDKNQHILALSFTHDLKKYKKKKK